MRRTGAGEIVTRTVWLLEIHLVDTALEPWLLLSDWEVESEEQALRIFQMYRQRWGVEDSFKFTKECLGWEEVQLLSLEVIRMLVGLAWVAAGFLYQMGVTLQWESEQLLARLGGASKSSAGQADADTRAAPPAGHADDERVPAGVLSGAWTVSS